MPLTRQEASGAELRRHDRRTTGLIAARSDALAERDADAVPSPEPARAPIAASSASATARAAAVVNRLAGIATEDEAEARPMPPAGDAAAAVISAVPARRESFAGNEPAGDFRATAAGEVGHVQAVDDQPPSAVLRRVDPLAA